MTRFLDPTSPEALDPNRKKLIRAIDNLIGSRMGMTIELDYAKHLTENEYEWLHLRIDQLLEGPREVEKRTWWNTAIGAAWKRWLG